MAEQSPTERQAALYNVFAAATSECDPRVPVKFGEKTYTLEYGYEAIRGIKEKYGLIIPKDQEKLSEFLDDAENIVGLLHLGLLANHRGITLDDVQALYVHRHMTHYISAITLALTAFMPSADLIRKVLGLPDSSEPAPPFAGGTGGTGAGPVQ